MDPRGNAWLPDATFTGCSDRISCYLRTRVIAPAQWRDYGDTILARYAEHEDDGGEGGSRAYTIGDTTGKNRRTRGFPFLWSRELVPFVPWDVPSSAPSSDTGHRPLSPDPLPAYSSSTDVFLLGGGEDDGKRYRTNTESALARTHLAIG